MFIEKLKEVKNYEKLEKTKKYRYSQQVMTFVILGADCIIMSVTDIINRSLFGFISEIINALVFFAALFLLTKTKNSSLITMSLSAVMSAVLFCFFTYEADKLHSLDAYWLWILVMPFIFHYVGGVYYGSISCIFPFVLSVSCMWSPLKKMHSDYGENILFYYPAILIVVAVLSAMMQYRTFYFQSTNDKLENQKLMMERQYKQRLKEQIDQQAENEDTVSRLRHDIRHYETALLGFIESGDIDSAKKLLKEGQGKFLDYTPMEFCENRLLNNFFVVYTNRLKKKGIAMQVKSCVPESICISNIDISSVIGNLLENAEKGAEAVKDGTAEVFVRIEYIDEKLKILVTNTIAKPPEFDDDGIPLRSEKRLAETGESHGMGTRQILDIARSYGGCADFKADDGKFTARTIIPAKSIENK